MTDAKAKSASPYLFFDGRCEEAIDYYKQALGAEVEALMRFADAPAGGPPVADAMKTKIMHASFKIGSTAIMVSDGMCSGDSRPNFGGFSLALTVPGVPAAEKLFDVLAADGKVMQPLIETFFAPRFGIVADKFGLSWMIVSE